MTSLHNISGATPQWKWRRPSVCCGVLPWGKASTPVLEFQLPVQPRRAEAGSRFACAGLADETGEYFGSMCLPASRRLDARSRPSAESWRESPAAKFTKNGSRECHVGQREARQRKMVWGRDPSPLSTLQGHRLAHSIPPAPGSCADCSSQTCGRASRSAAPLEIKHVRLHGHRIVDGCVRVRVGRRRVVC